MRKNLLVVLSFILVILSASFIAALELPTEPMMFYGDIEDSTGLDIPNGYYIVAKIDGVISGECEVINGIYGMGDYACVIVSHVFNKDVNFFIGDINIGSYPFEEKGMIELDFIVDNLPGNFDPLSNGVCEPDKGECSYNLLDCDASLTNACAENGVCDSLIGETCEFTQSDCGVCPTEPTGGSGGGSSGGGGGGGSSSSSSSSSSSGTVTTATPTMTFEPEQFGNATNETEEVQPEETQEKQGFFSRLFNRAPVTGEAVEENSKSGKSVKVFGIFIIVIVVLALLIFGVSKVRKNTVKENNTLKKSAAKNKKAGIKAAKVNGVEKASTKKSVSTPAKAESAEPKKKTSSKKKVSKKK